MLQLAQQLFHPYYTTQVWFGIFYPQGQLSNHLNAYKTYHDKLGNTLGTAVNHYNDTTKEFKKINKDIIKISGSTDLDINTDLIEKPSED